MDQRLSELDTILDDIHEQKLEFSAFDASIEDTEVLVFLKKSLIIQFYKEVIEEQFLIISDTFRR